MLIVDLGFNFQEHFRDPIPGTPATPGTGGRSARTPAGITPGAMSMVGAGTPGFGRSAPYTPTANTPFMTPFNTPGNNVLPGDWRAQSNSPGPSMTPRAAGYGVGSSTPRAGSSMTPRAGGFPGSATPGSSTPSARSSRDGGRSVPPQASPGGAARAPKSRSGNMWGDVAADWGGRGGRDRRGATQGGGDRRRDPGGGFCMFYKYFF